MNNLEIEKHKEKINSLSHVEMARLIRFAPLGHKYFNTSLPFWNIFNKRFKKLGGMTPKISKQIGF